MLRAIKKASILIILLIAIIAGTYYLKNKIFNKNESKELKDIVFSAGNLAPAGSMGGSNLSAMYYYVPDGHTFCAGFNWQLAKREQMSSSSITFINGGVYNGQQETTYVPNGEYEMPQSVAFAFYYYKNSLSTIQNIIWASEQWSSFLSTSTGLVGTHTNKYYTYSSGIYGRAYKFANFVYLGLNSSEQLGLTGGPSSDYDKAIDIMVNQNNDTYTVGPYTINMQNQGTPVKYGNGNIEDLIWEEIANYQGSDKFCFGEVTASIDYQNGGRRIAKIGSGTGTIEVLDEYGNHLKFPKFGQKFYIKYQSNKFNDGIVEKIKPIITYNYTKRFSGAVGVNATNGSAASMTLKMHRYKSSQVHYAFNNSLGGYKMFWYLLNDVSEWTIDEFYPHAENVPFNSWEWKYNYVDGYGYVDDESYWQYLEGHYTPDDTSENPDLDSAETYEEWLQRHKDAQDLIDEFNKDPDKFAEEHPEYGGGAPFWDGYAFTGNIPQWGDDSNEDWNNNNGEWYASLWRARWSYAESSYTKDGYNFGELTSANEYGASIDPVISYKDVDIVRRDLEANIRKYLRERLGWSSAKVNGMSFEDFGVEMGFFIANGLPSSNGLNYSNATHGFSSGSDMEGQASRTGLDGDISWHPNMSIDINFKVVEQGKRRYEWTYTDEDGNTRTVNSKDTQGPTSESEKTIIDGTGTEWTFSGYTVDKANSKPYKIQAELTSNEGSGVFANVNGDKVQNGKTEELVVAYDDFNSKEGGNPKKYWEQLVQLLDNALFGNNGTANVFPKIVYGFKFTKGTATQPTPDGEIQPAFVIEDPIIRTTYKVSGGNGAEIFTFGGEEVNLYLGGNVWQDMPSNKVGDCNGHKQNTSLDLSGIEVKLYDVTQGNSGGQPIVTTTTDKQGRYGFQKMNPLHKYQIVFTYDGMRFESTLYKDDHSEHLRGEYSVAQESKTDRKNFNNKFESIDSSPHNYYNSNAGEWRRAYGLYQKIEDEDGTYVKYSNSGINAGSFRYYDALEIFKLIVTNGHNFDQTGSATMGGNVNSADGTYYNAGDNNSMYKPTVNTPYSSFEGTFKAFLKNQRIGNISNPLGLEPNVKPPSDEEINNIWLYIMDTLISSSTIAYPDTELFLLKDVDGLEDREVILATGTYKHLYTIPHDQSRQVDFGLKLRTNADLWLSNDVYKATILINGKKQEYFYDKKRSETDSQGNWVVNGKGTYDFENGSDSSNRANDDDYNGTVEYDREIRKSEYLYNGEDAGTTNIKNLQVFVTYKIALKNQSTDVFTKINEVVDYYDSDQYTYAKDRTIVQQNTFLGDANGNKIADINVSEGSIFERKYTTMQNYYAMSYNINDLFDYKSLYITGIRSVKNNSELLESNEFTYLYITFMVNTDPSTGKVKIEQDVDKLLNGEIVNFTGKKNIAEINGYSTYYLNTQENKYDAIGVVDLDSNPGSLRGRDLNPESGLIMSSLNSWENRLQDDTDNSRNISLKIYNDPSRSISGYTYEDARTKIEHGATIGNGVYNSSDTDTLGNSDKKINGITVQLVELQQNVDAEGFAVGTYSGEHIWSSLSYSKNGNEWIDEIDSSRYSSGTGKSKVIIQGTGIFEVKERDLDKEYEDSGGKDGVYMFDSLPPGDFVVRFIYGDTTETVLTNDNDNEVIKALNKSNEDIQEKIESELVEDEYKYDDTKGTKYGVGYGVLGTKGLNSKSYTGQDYKSTIYQLNVKQNKDVNFHLFKGKNDIFQPNGVVGYNDIEGQNYNRDNADDRASMYNYSFYQSDKDTKIDQTNTDADAPKIGEGISDAKDVWSYRSDEQNYSSGSQTENSNFDIQTLKNHRAEVLASGTQLTTKAKHNIVGDTPNSQEIKDGVNSQKDALIELMQNTRMVAQTGLISTQLEYDLQEKNATQVYSKDNNLDENGKRINIQNMKFDLRDVDLGLTERPRAQLIISKELVNIQIRLANNQILFDTTQSVPNLSYGQHKIYEDEEFYESSIKKGDLNYKPYMLRYDVMKKVDDRQEELVSVIMDEELMYGATVRLKYKISVDNIGEVDYQDKNFYYNGETVDTSFGNIAKTNAIRVIDYVTNEIDFDENYQNDPKDWVTLTKELILGEDDTEDDDLVNKEFEENLNTYTTLISTDRLSGELIPRYVDPDTENYSNSRREIELVLSTLLANTVENKNLVYANMVEILETTNSMGRRMYLSEAGNQEMPYQSEEDSIDESTKWIHPDELDTDSGQKVQISVPTGGNKEYSRTIIVLIISLTILGTSSVIIKKKVLDI